MIVIKTKKGTWDGDEWASLLWEKCSNTKCSNGELHYPASMERPKCPDCQTNLIGLKLKKDFECRVAYYLGAVI